MALDDTVFFKKSPLLPYAELRQANGSSACYHTHSHDEFSFGVIDMGRANYQNLNQHNDIVKGDTVTINPGDAHSCNPAQGEWSYRMLFLDAAYVGQQQREIFKGDTWDFLPFEENYLRNPHSFQLFEMLFNSLLSEHDLLAGECLILDFIQHAFAPHHEIHPDMIRADITRVSRVKDMIMDSLEQNISLDEFSLDVGLSRYHLVRSFKDAFGQSPHAFQLDQRIKKAKLMLQTGRSLIDTASDLGFADQSHFQRHFKKRMAVTPKHYQSFFV
jgi:AraC-like DNA-binding protein